MSTAIANDVGNSSPGLNGSTDVMELHVDGDTSQDRGDKESKLNVDRYPVDPRLIMDTLIDISQEESDKQLFQPRVEMLLDSPQENPENARFHGWITFPIFYQKPSVNNERRKRKSNLYSGPAEMEDFYLFKKKPYVLLPDYWHPGVMWRSVVESDTYRYVDDNGCYRYLKTNAALGKDQSELNGQFQRRTLPLAPTRREIQQEITRDLRHVVESHEEQTSSYTPTNNIELHDSVSGPIKLVVEKLGKPDDNPHPVSEPGDYLGDAVGVDQSDCPFQLPSMDVPLLSKAFADRLMENFSSKISVLEEQIRKDAKIKMLQKSTESTTPNIVQYRRSSLQDLTPETINAISQSNYPGLDKKGSFPQSTFEVIKVFSDPGKKPQKFPLKPLEKVTPGMRQVVDMHKMQIAHLRYNSVKGNSDNCITTGYSFNDSEVNPIHLKDDEKVKLDSHTPKDKYLNINNMDAVGLVKSGDTGLARRSSSKPMSGHKKGQANVTKPKRSKSFLYEQVEKKLTGFHSAPVGKPKRDSKDTQNVARRLLPELMGKKMPATVSIQKWL
ncbi:uncharacterized protein LOC135495436 isoform X2 [Lineus longissimus]|uniref:uncharacterized protein LOC135495436 isoform X2 n=1 Tax=Lineus longissimus TaxID=88925 RepID=UPI00315C83AB